MSRSRLRLLPLVLAFSAVSAGRADLNTPPTAWSNFNPPGWTVFQIGGIPARDFEATGSCVDPTNGGAAFTGPVDLSSGGTLVPNTYNAANCNPAAFGGGTCCGPESTAFVAYYNGGNDANISNDYFAMRMRVNLNPRDSSGDCMSNSHWNFLMDPDADGFKEWWVDLWGNEDRIRIMFENNASMLVTNDNETPPATDTVINELTACAAQAVASCGSGADVRDCQFSHSRVCGVGSLQSDANDCDAATDSTLEWYVDIQVPINFLRTSTGADMSTSPITLGTTVLTFPPTTGFFFSTSDSSTDPLQKDYIATCTATPGGPCDFGNPTAVTLSYFRAQPTGSGMRFEWSTDSESGNVGFNLLADSGKGYRLISSRPITTKNPYSLSRLDYSVEIAGVSGERFAIEDIDLNGKTRRHGDFVSEREYGSRRPAELRDWASIRTEHQAHEAGRNQAQVALLRAGAATVPSVDVLVDRDGIQRVTYEQLLAAGIDWTNKVASRVALVSESGPVPIRVVSPARFGPGSYVEFVGAQATGVYTRTNVYRLKLDASSALRIKEQPGAAKNQAPSYLASVGADDSLAWSFSAPGSDPWYRDWVVVWSGTPVERSYGLNVDGLVAGDGARLKASIWGMTDWPAGDDHHVEVLLNGTLLADRRFDGLQELVLNEAIPAGLLRPGANTITVRAPADNGQQFEVLAVDKFSIDYPRIFAARNGALSYDSASARFAIDGFHTPNATVYKVQGGTAAYITNPQVTRVPFGDYRVTFGSPAGSTASRYFVAERGAIAAPQVRATVLAPEIRTGLAEYLVISHPDFLAGLSDLVAARQADGLSTKVVDVEKVYAEFGHGIFGPEAIRDYIRYAGANLGTRYVLLVGADSYDYLDELGLGSISFVPTLYAENSPIVRWAPADGLYGDLDSDMVPDIAVGRFPAHNAAELASIVGKTLAYPTAGHAGRALLAADQAGREGNFTAMSEAVAATMGPAWDVSRVYLDQQSIADARAALISGINDGVAYTQYLGHSGTSLWSFANLFTAADAASLNNPGRPTVVGQWGCWNTFYVTPDASSMADRLLLEGDRGAAAVFGSSALASVDSSHLMSRLMTDALFDGATIGEALISAKSQMAASSPWMIDLIRSFNLLGDPALRIQP